MWEKNGGKGGDAALTNDEFTELVQQYERLVYTICYQFVRDSALAEDLAQETFLAAYTHRGDCPAEHYKPWLARIASNKARDYLKSAYHRRVLAAEDDTLAVLPTAYTEPPPEELMLKRDEASRAKQAILDLKEPYRQAAILFFLEEKSVNEVAGALDRPVKTVHTQLFRARLLLQRALERGNGA